MQVLNRITVGGYTMVEEPMMYIRQKNCIHFNVAAVEQLGLSKGDHLEFEISGQSLYVRKTVDKSGFLLRRVGNNVGLVFASKALCTLLRNRSKKSADSYVYFTLSESALEPKPFISWEVQLKGGTNG